MVFRCVSNLVLKSFQGVHELDKLGPIDKEQMSLLRKEEGILMVDDIDCKEIAKTLKDRFGFCNITPIESFPSDDLIRKNRIIVTDVRFEGKDKKSNGLKFAGSIKKQYPNKQVIVISGQLRTNAYADDRHILETVDGYYDKNRDSIERLSELLNKCLVELNHPAYVWRNLRNQMLNYSVGGDKDKTLVDVLRLEDIYVRKCLQVYRKEGFKQSEWKDELLGVLRIAKEASELIEILLKILA